MTTKKAINVQFAMFVALLPCVLIVNQSGNFLLNVLGLFYAFSLAWWISCTTKGRKWLRLVEKSNKVLFNISSEE